MAAVTFTFTNTNPVDELAYPSGAWLVGGEGVTPAFIEDPENEGKLIPNPDAVNPGAKTGPYGNGKKLNDVYIPLPRTNFQIKLAAGADPVIIETEDTLEIEFFKALNGTVPGLLVDDGSEAEDDGQ